jgi:toxin YhaV
MTERHGWILSIHPLFLAQLDRLRLAASPKSTICAEARLLARLHHLIFDRIPADPQSCGHAVTATAGLLRHGWYAARFAGGRFTLYYQADPTARRIVYAWVADRDAMPDATIQNDAFVLHGHICAVTAAGQMTLPQAARDALGLRAGSQIGYWLDGGQFLINRLPAAAIGTRPAAVIQPALPRLTPPSFRHFPVHAVAPQAPAKRPRRVLQ